MLRLSKNFRILLGIGRYAQGDIMKEKIKKYLCLMLSFVFVLSNCQLFAQNIPSEMPTVNPAISEATIANMEKELSLANLKVYS